MFKGVYTAIVTPMKNGKIDYEMLEKFIEFQINNGISGLVPAGTTGEAATLTKEECKSLFEFVVKKVNGRVKVIGGTGTNCTDKVIENTKMALETGCDGALIVSPYYNKPPQRGLIEHYKKIANSVDIPIILYNVPGRTSSNIEAQTTIELSKIKNIVAVKEASGNITQITKILNGVDSNFSLLSGEDALNLPIIAVGGNGFISVLSNIAPKLLVDMYNAFISNNIEKAQNLNKQLIDLTETLFIETNPIVVKSGVNLLGYCEKEIRLPLVWIKKDYEDKLKNSMNRLGLI